MTKAKAAALLAELAEGDTSEYGDALRVAVKALTPKAAKPKVSVNVAAFLKLRCPAGTAKSVDYGEWAALRDASSKLSPAAAAQFAYGSRDRVHPDATVLAASRVGFLARVEEAAA